tara:strand:- start:911 stop:1762 length:852 start_codon:yes stop_codon:yes gene_type:complete
MKNKTINIALIGKTNAGKSTFINEIVGEQISIQNKKINTTLEPIIGIVNINNVQIVFFDTPGLNLFKNTNSLEKKQKTQIWEVLNNVNMIIYLIDVVNFDFLKIKNDIKKIDEFKKPILIVFNKIDLINKNKILIYIKKLDELNLIKDFFSISAKFNKGLDLIINYLKKNSIIGSWKYQENEITNKSDIFIANECTRNALLKYLHKEIPYNLSVRNKLYKILNKKNTKIKQIIEINNIRYKSIILGKKGEKIKKIRESSQKEIEKILKTKVHLYLEILKVNVK